MPSDTNLRSARFAFRGPFAALALGAALTVAGCAPVVAQEAPSFASGNRADPVQYADLADLVVVAPMIVRATVRDVIAIDPERVVNPVPGMQRSYIEAETKALIRGSTGLPETIRYVVDLPTDARGRVAKWKKRDVLLFAQPVAPGSGDLQLSAPDGQLEWTADREARVRAIAREAVADGAPPRITGVQSAFHVPGTVIGEGETQIFLATESGAPASITILSREGQEKVWAVSLTDIVDEAARAPRRDTLLWYRLACSLPRRLPEAAIQDGPAQNVSAARRDYDLVVRELGNCTRGRAPAG